LLLLSSFLKVVLMLMKMLVVSMMIAAMEMMRPSHLRSMAELKRWRRWR